MTTRQEIETWFEMGLTQGGMFGDTPASASHMIVLVDEYDHTDYPVYIKVGDDPKKYEVGSMQRIMEVYDLRLPMGPQMEAGRAYNNKMSIRDEDMSFEWITALSASDSAPPPHPLVQEVDPEIEALLGDYDPWFFTPMRGEGWYRVYYANAEDPDGPWETISDMADGLSMVQYPKDGYIMFSSTKTDDEGKFWSEVSNTPSLNPDDLLPFPTWQDTLFSNWCSISLFDFITTATRLGYDYFAWNDVVYATAKQDITLPVCLVEEVL